MWGPGVRPAPTRLAADERRPRGRPANASCRRRPVERQPVDAGSPPAPTQPGRDGDARSAARDRPGVARRAPVRPTHRAHRSVPLQPRRHDGRRRQDGSCDAGADRGARARCDADRADLGSRALLPRRRQPGPRRGRAPSLRRSQLAVHRRLRRAADVPVRNGHRPHGRLLRGSASTASSLGSSTSSGPSPSTCSRSASRRSW